MKIKGVTIKFDGDHSDSLIDLGEVTLSLDGRENKYDIVKSNRFFNGHETEVECELAAGHDIFPDCGYDLTEADFHSDDLVAEIYIADADGSDAYAMGDFEHATLFIKFTGGMAKAIDLSLEN